MPTLSDLIGDHFHFWLLQEWTGCQFLVEEVLEKRVVSTTQKFVSVSAKEWYWYVDGIFVLRGGWWEIGKKMYQQHYNKDGRWHGSWNPI